MLTKIATSLTRRLQRKGVVSNEAEDIYVYGFELLVSFVFSTTLILTLGWILGAVLETFCFLGVFNKAQATLKLLSALEKAKFPQNKRDLQTFQR